MKKLYRKKILHYLKINAIITFYFIQIFFILMYIQPEIQEFVYVRF